MNGPPRPQDDARHSVAALLLSHHPPEHLHRTVVLGWGRHRVRLCARCLGVAIGAVAAAAAAAVAGPPAFSPWLVACCALAAAAGALVDFHGQMMRRWESTNARRLVTGAAFGAGLVVSVHQAAAAAVLWPVSVPALVVVYFIWVASGRRRSARMVRHLCTYAAYYHRCRAEDARRCVRRRFGRT